MGKELFGWIRRHHRTVLAFVIGMALGILIVAFAYFSSRSATGAMVLGYGVHLSGHSDIDEDLLWFLCGAIVGAGVLALTWWRDSKAQAEGLAEEDVLNRLLAPPPAEAGRTEADKGKEILK